MLNAQRLLANPAVAVAKGMHMANSSQLPLSYFNLTALSDEESQSLQSEYNMQAVINEAKRSAK